MLKNFSVLQKSHVEIAEGGIICLIDDVLPLDEKIMQYHYNVYKILLIRFWR